MKVKQDKCYLLTQIGVSVARYAEVLLSLRLVIPSPLAYFPYMVVWELFAGSQLI